MIDQQTRIALQEELDLAMKRREEAEAELAAARDAHEKAMKRYNELDSLVGSLALVIAFDQSTPLSTDKFRTFGEG